MGDGEQRQRDVEVRILDEHIPKLMLGTSNSASRSIVSRQVPMLFKSKISIGQCLNMFDCCSTHMMYIYLILYIYIHMHIYTLNRMYFPQLVQTTTPFVSWPSLDADLHSPAVGRRYRARTRRQRRLKAQLFIELGKATGWGYHSNKTSNHDN